MPTANPCVACTREPATETRISRPPIPSRRPRQSHQTGPTRSRLASAPEATPTPPAAVARTPRADRHPTRAQAQDAHPHARKDPLGPGSSFSPPTLSAPARRNIYTTAAHNNQTNGQLTDPPPVRRSRMPRRAPRTAGAETASALPPRFWVSPLGSHAPLTRCSRSAAASAPSLRVNPLGAPKGDHAGLPAADGVIALTAGVGMLDETFGDTSIAGSDAVLAEPGCRLGQA